MTVGWDPPLGTYYAQVYETEVEDRPIGWMGTTPGEIPTLVRLLREVRPWALIDDHTGTNLEADRRRRPAQHFAS